LAIAQGNAGQVTGGAGFSDVTRRILERAPMLGNDQELVMVEVIFPPGVAAPIHHHTVRGLNYIVEGVAESAYGSEAPRRYQAGETLQDFADIPHTIFRNPDPQKRLRFLIFYAAAPGRTYTIIP
jgi:quercetin dioxygenase-like cupin family protein